MAGTFTHESQGIGASQTTEKSNQALSTLDVSGLTDFIKSVVEEHNKQKEDDQAQKDQARVMTETKVNLETEAEVEEGKTKYLPSYTDTSVAKGTTLPVYAKAFLDTISAGEGTSVDKSYQVIVGLGHGKGVENAPAYFEDYAKHPNIIGYVSEEGPSTAAGRYQFTYETWQEVSKALGLKDFSPESQDKAAWYLAKQRYTRNSGRDLEEDLANGQVSYIKKALGPTWTSLKTNFDFTKFYSKATGKYTPQTPAQQTAEKTSDTWGY